jgi:translation initiation factor 1 (eIF-1/SUI1)
MLEVGWIPVEGIETFWSEVEPFIARSCEESLGDLPLIELKEKLSVGEWTLIVVYELDTAKIEGAVVVHIYDRVNDKVAFVTAIGGLFITNKHSFERLKELLRVFGATCIEGNVRDSVLKLLSKLGFEKKSTTIKYTL